LCKGAVQVRKAAVYNDERRTPIFTLNFECAVIFKNRVDQFKIDNVTSVEEIDLKIENLNEGIRSAKTNLHAYKDLIHKVYCLHVHKGKQKIASMVYLELAKVNFSEVSEVTSDQVAWLNIDTQILQYQLAKYRGAVGPDQDFEKRISSFKLTSVLENSLESPAKVYIVAFLGKTGDYSKSNCEIYSFIKGTENGYFKLPLASKMILAGVDKIKKCQNGKNILNDENESKSHHFTDDEMKEMASGYARQLGNSPNKTSLKKGAKHLNPSQEYGTISGIISTQNKHNITKTKGKKKAGFRGREDVQSEEEENEEENIRENSNNSEGEIFTEEAKAEASRNRKYLLEDRNKSGTQDKSRLDRSRPIINDDHTTSMMKAMHLYDQKKPALLSDKELDDESDDSFVDNIFQKINPGVSKVKDLEQKPGLGQSTATIRRASQTKGSANPRVYDQLITNEEMGADADEKFNLPKGKLVALLSKMEMKNMHQTQAYENNQAELDNLKETLIKLVEKSKNLKSANRNFKFEREKTNKELDRLVTENEELKKKLEESNSERQQLILFSKDIKNQFEDVTSQLK
jgi:hypothetical protein